MHTSKPFPYRPRVVARQHKPDTGPIALAGNDPDVVRPDYDAPYRRGPKVHKLDSPFTGFPEIPVIQPVPLHQPAAAPRQVRPAGTAPSHPALPPLTFHPRTRAYCPVGMTLAAVALIAAGIPYKAPSQVAVDDWCSKWPAGLSCKQQNAGK